MKESAKFKIEMFNPSVLMHPLTYGNKIMFGSTQGMLQLWNMDTGSFIHHFDHWKPHRINAITQVKYCVLLLNYDLNTILISHVQYVLFCL